MLFHKSATNPSEWSLSDERCAVRGRSESLVGVVVPCMYAGHSLPLSTTKFNYSRIARLRTNIARITIVAPCRHRRSPPSIILNWSLAVEAVNDWIVNLANFNEIRHKTSDA